MWLYVCVGGVLRTEVRVLGCQSPVALERLWVNNSSRCCLLLSLGMVEEMNRGVEPVTC